MAAVTGSVGPVDEGPKRLLGAIAAAKSAVSDGFVPDVGMPGGADTPAPSGWFSGSLVAGWWPTDSESGVIDAGNQFAAEQRGQQRACDDAQAKVDQVFNYDWLDGAGAEAAQAHYRWEHALHLHLVEVCGALANAYRSAGAEIGSVKRTMRQWAEQGEEEVETALRSAKTTAEAQLAINTIRVKYRPMIGEVGTSLYTHMGEHAARIQLLGSGSHGSQGDGNTGQNGKGPKNRDGIQLVDNETDGTGNGGTGGGTSDALTPVPSQSAGMPGGAGVPGTSDALTPVPSQSAGMPGGAGVPGTPDALTPVLPQVPRAGPASSSVPPMPSLPSMPGGGGLPGGGGGLGPLSGLMGGMQGGGLPTGGLNAPGLNSPPAMPTLGTDFARGLAAGAGAAGGAVPPSVPQPPAAPLAAPVGETPLTATPASATPPPVAASPQAGVPAASTGAPAGSGMTPYGSVLPPAGGSSGGSAGAVPPPAVPPGGGAGPVGAGAAGVVPALARGERRDPVVRRDTAASDLELARAAVAELAAAGCVADPSVDWAVAVGRGASGMPTLWLGTNEGACYLPPGVFVPKTMPLAGGFDADFDVRWFGWINPAETVLRAVTARGEAVSAVATTCTLRSEVLRESVRELATGVAPGESGGPASEHSRARSHRLQTVDPALFDDLHRVGEPAARTFCRELTQRVVFGGGESLSAVAQGVARALVAGRWPSEQEWEALGAEYDLARLTVGSHRLGANGVESGDMLASYHRLFITARRLETLLCWKQPGAQLADVAYAAWMAGVRATFHQLT